MSALSLTSDLVGDVLLGGDDLVHVCPYGGLQRGAGHLTLLQHCLILGLTLSLHQAVYRITDLHTQTQRKHTYEGRDSCSFQLLCLSE